MEIREKYSHSQLQSPKANEYYIVEAGLLTYSPRPCLPVPIKIGTVTKRMGFGIWSLQLRDSSGSSPDSLLIPVVKPGTKTLQM